MAIVVLPLSVCDSCRRGMAAIAAEIQAIRRRSVPGALRERSRAAGTCLRLLRERYPFASFRVWPGSRRQAHVRDDLEGASGDGAIVPA